MPTTNKRKVVEELTDRLTHSDMAVVTDYRGLTVSDMAQLRRQLRNAGVDYEVAKNTLLRLAAQRAGYPDMGPLLAGPTAVAFASGDVAKAAKALREYARTSKVFAIKGGVLGRQVMNADDVNAVAELPSREQLIAKVVGTMQSPIVNLVSVLGGPMRSLAYVLQARMNQLESAG